jgi:PAS domain S-box-containing protein
VAEGARVDDDHDDAGRAALEQALRERVKELQALRAVQLAVESAMSLEELLDRVARALVDGMQFPALARVEIRVDRAVASAGVDGRLVEEIARDVVVDGRARGRISVGYVEPRGLLVPEEADLVHAVARSLGLHVGLRDARAASDASVERLRRVLAGLPSAVFLIDRDRRVEVVTLAPNFPLRRVPDQTFRLDDWEDPDAPRLNALVAGAFAGKPARREVEWRGSWWDLRVEPQHDEQGVDQVLLMVLDITEHHRRRELEAHLSTLVGSANLAMIGLSPDGTVTSWNRGAVELFGDEAIATVGRLIGEIAPDAPELRDAVLDVGGGRIGATSTALAHRRPDGSRVHAVAHVSPIRDVVGVVTSVLVIVEDRTDREQAERALAASEEQLRLITDAVGDVVYRLALDPLRLEYVSPSSAWVLGYAPSTLIADLRLLRERTHPDDRRRALRGLRARSGETAVRWRWRHADGRWVWVEDHRRVLVHDGEAIAVVGVVRDVTDEQHATDETRAALDAARRVAEELRQVDQMKTTFLSAVSHELRTPLTSVVGFAETAMHRTTDTSVAGMLERLVANTRRLESLVDDLLDVDRLARGMIVPERSITDLGALARRVARRMETSRVIEVRADPLDAAVDAVMIERVIDNLVRNAHRHTPPGTRVWVTVSHEAATDEVVLVVADDGPGVPEDLRERVFEPFTQGPHSAYAASPGTGIGLSLVQRFVEVHDGVVVLDERPGGGARFTIRLPRGLEERRADPSGRS